MKVLWCFDIYLYIYINTGIHGSVYLSFFIFFFFFFSFPPDRGFSGKNLRQFRVRRVIN